MHQLVQAKIALKEGKKIKKEKKKEFSYNQYWDDSKKKADEEKDEFKEKIKMQVWNLKHVPVYVKTELVKFIEFGTMRKDIKQDCKKYLKEIKQGWPEELRDFILEKFYVFN